ncbi:MAG: polysaccharide deacetylase family protein [Candidatus Acidiferrum sp.]
MSVTPEVSKPSVSRSVARVIKLGISLLYLAWRRIGRLLSGNQVGTCVVLYYHSVPAKYQERFAQQMRLLADGMRVIHIHRIDDLPANANSVVITFDDALQNFAANAVPVLVGSKIPSTVFVVTDALGSKPGWGEGYYGPDERIMSEEELGKLPDLITVGSHTLTHPNLTMVSPESAATELKVSREKLETLLRRPIPLFSFPHGAYNDALLRECKDAGYQRVFTTEPELISAATDKYVVGRVPVDPWDWWIEFRLKVAGAYCWQPLARNAWRNIRALAGAN